MTDRYSDLLSTGPASRSGQLDAVLTTLLSQAPEMEAAAVVSFDGLPMASALPPGMDEDRVAAMSAALLSLGERAAQGLGRGDLSQVYVEGESGTVFLVSADDEAVLVAVGARGAKVGLLLFEVRRAAQAVAAVLRVDDREPQPMSFPTQVAPSQQPPDHYPLAEPSSPPAAQPRPAQTAEPVPYPPQRVEPLPNPPQRVEPLPNPPQRLEPQYPVQPEHIPHPAGQQVGHQEARPQPATYQPEPPRGPDTRSNGSSPRTGPASWS
jgi:uncharacterized protein